MKGIETGDRHRQLRHGEDRRGELHVAVAAVCDERSGGARRLLFSLLRRARGAAQQGPDCCYSCYHAPRIPPHGAPDIGRRACMPGDLRVRRTRRAVCGSAGPDVAAPQRGAGRRRVVA